MPDKSLTGRCDHFICNRSRQNSRNLNFDQVRLATAQKSKYFQLRMLTATLLITESARRYFIHCIGLSVGGTLLGYGMRIISAKYEIPQYQLENFGNHGTLSD